TQRPETLAQASLAMRDREDFVELLTMLTMPVSIIVGEQDSITPPVAARALSERVKTGSFVQIAGAGHISPLEQPAAVAAALLSLTESTVA
ncbi:MAG TPA: alpha/beta fold hydrolase, partial [Tepidisphaeraceae bacterium]